MDNHEGERVLAILAHILSLFAFFIGPLVIYLIADQSKPFARSHAREALNFQITVALAGFVSFILAFVGIGILLLFAIGIGFMVFTIMAAVAASNNEEYRYPINIRFIS